MTCNRNYARWHGDEKFVELTCTCGQCADEEYADEWLDWLAMQHHSLEEQGRWYLLVELYGYELPAGVWQRIATQMAEWQAADVEMAERKAGWDPNP